MEKHYKVFLSSTNNDLKRERRAVIQELIQGRYFPVAQEMFAASGRPTKESLRDQLLGCDYLVLLIGNRYGSPVDGEDVSFTEWEYNLARDNGIPVLAFMLEGLPPTEAENQDKLEAFVERVARGQVFRRVSKRGLASAILHSLREQPEREGWVRYREAIRASGHRSFDWNKLEERGYYATSFLCRLRLVDDKRLSFTMQARVIPLDREAEVLSFGLDKSQAPPEWGEAIISEDIWELGAHSVSKPGTRVREENGKKQRPSERTANRDWMTYRYVCDFEKPRIELVDRHDFSFYTDSVRIEASLMERWNLEVHRNGRYLTELPRHLSRDGRVRCAIDDPTPWGPGDSFTWRIYKDESRPNASTG